MRACYAGLISLLCYHASFACTTIIVGKKASTDHSIMIGRNVDAIINKPVHFIQHAKSHSYIYKSQSNNFIYPMPDNLLAYSGIPDANSKNNDKFFEEAGFNDLGIAVSGTETILSNHKTLHLDPYNKKSGIQEDAIVSVLLPQVKSARDGVILLGQIIEKYGSGEGFGVAFADKKEAWYLENIGGHNFVAVKIPDDSYFVSANQGRIGCINIADTENVIISNALKNNLAHISSNSCRFENDNINRSNNKSGLKNHDQYIDFFERYTDNSEDDITYNHYRVWNLQKLYTPSFKNNLANGRFPLFLKPDKTISTNMVEAGLRIYYKGSKFDPYTNANPNVKYRPVAVFRTQESHILKIRDNGMPLPISNILYLSLGMTPLSIYVPFYMGSDIPHDYTIGDFNADNTSAFWRFRKLQILAMENFKDYAPIVIDSYAKLSTKIMLEQAEFEKRYSKEYTINKNQANLDLNNFTKHIVNEVFLETDKLTNQLMTLEADRIDKKYLFMGD